MIFDPSENGRKYDGDEREEGAASRQLRKCAKCPRHADNPGDEGHNPAETDSADSVRGALGHGVQIFGTDKTVEPLDESIVQDKHDAGEPPSPPLVPQKDLADITNVLDFRVAQAEFPEYC